MTAAKGRYALDRRWRRKHMYGTTLLLAGMPCLRALPQASTSGPPPGPAVRLDLPHSLNPLDTYRATEVAPANLSNSPRLDALIQDGVLVLSLDNAISLALENNLDLAIARYNIPIARADVLRTRAGGTTRGVNTGVVQNTPGGGVGGFGAGGTGAGAGGTSGGAGGAGTGASGLVQSTLGSGTAVSSFDPLLTGDLGLNHETAPLSNLAINGVPTLRQNAFSGDIGYQQAFPLGTAIAFTFNADRLTTNSRNNVLNPQLDSAYQFSFRQPLLAGFGLATNLRYLRIAKNNQKISDEAFKLQVISTVTQIANLYWDLVSAYEDEQVKSRSLEFANQVLDTGRKQLQLQAIPALDVTKDEGEVAKAEQELTVARSALTFQELLIKNALTKNLDDPVLESMHVRPADLTPVAADAATDAAVEDVLKEATVEDALAHRVELAISNINLRNRAISRDAVRNSLLPSVNLTGTYGGVGLAGVVNSAAGTPSTAPGAFGGAFQNAFNNSSPNYFIGLNVQVPLRNRLAKSDQYRSELETRQAELLLQEQRKQIRIEVRNAQYALQQSEARVKAAGKARDLAQKIFEITGKEQSFGAGSALQTLGARHDLATAESALVSARTAFQKARIELDRAVGRTLDRNSISLESAREGQAQQAGTGRP